MHRPAGLFDREWEWARLVDFVADDRPMPTLGVVSGRRRQGKTMLLQGLVEQFGGFFAGCWPSVPPASRRNCAMPNRTLTSSWSTSTAYTETPDPWT